MPTRREIEADLLAGRAVGPVQPEGPISCRLFAYVLENAPPGGEAGDDAYHDGLLRCYIEASDAQDTEDEGTADTSGVGGPETEEGAPAALSRWLLTKITTRNFGGLNSLEGEPLEVEVDSKGLRVEGANGRGKSSLASAVVWALTGYRLTGQEGPSEALTPKPLYPPAKANEAKLPPKLRVWPPVLSYPYGRGVEDIAGLSAVTSVTLTFTDQDGNTADICRRLGSDGTHDFSGLGALDLDPVLVEAAVLMPNRIPAIRLGEQDAEISALVKLLGLEPLGIVGDHIISLLRANSRFMSNPREKDIEAKKQALDRALAQALTEAEALDDGGKTAALLRPLSGPGKTEDAETVAANLLARASEMVVSVQDKVGPGLDLASPRDRRTLSDALVRLKDKYDPERLLPIPLLNLLEALAREQDGLSALQQVLREVEEAFAAAVVIRDRQRGDKRLRLKALAARQHQAEHGDIPIVDCPLCRQGLADPERQALAQELQELKAEAEEVERDFAQACTLLYDRLLAAVPASLGEFSKVGMTVPPSQAVTEALVEFLEADGDITVCLGQGLPRIVEQLHDALRPLPDVPENDLPSLPEIDADGEDRRLRKAFERVCDLLCWGAWWGQARPPVATAWKTVIGDGGREKTLIAGLQAVQAAVDQAKPYEAVATRLKEVARLCREHDEMRLARQRKDAIKQALLPFKELRKLVEQEAEAALKAVSDRATDIFNNKIYRTVGSGIREPQAVQDGNTGKKRLAVLGSFEGSRVDSRFVANTSWLRAFLWSFTLAFRESVIERLGHNPLPLMVLDDPQVCFDEGHMLRWARWFSGMATGGDAQFILTSHDRSFRRRLEETRFPAAPVIVLGLDQNRAAPMMVYYGTALDRLWNEFAAAESSGIDVEAKAQAYVKGMREHVENVLAHIIRNCGVSATNTTVGGLMTLLERADLPEALRLPGPQALRVELSRHYDFRSLLNNSHHDDQLAEVDAGNARAIHDEWEAIFRPALDKAVFEVESFLSYAWKVTQPSHPPRPVPMRGQEYLRSRPLLQAGTLRLEVDSRLSFEPATDQKMRPVAPAAAVAVTSQAMHPLTRSGDVALLHPHRPPRDGEIAVAAFEESAFLGVVHQDSNTSTVLSLSARSGSGRMPPPRSLVRSGCHLHPVVGFIWSSQTSPDDDASDDIAELSDDEAIGLSEDAMAIVLDGVTVGDLAGPGERLLCDPWRSPEEARELQARLVVVECSAPGTGIGVHVGQWHVDGAEAWISRPSGEDGPPLRVALEPCESLHVLRVAPVTGVLF